jgi:hypothetical protein
VALLETTAEKVRTLRNLARLEAILKDEEFEPERRDGRLRHRDLCDRNEELNGKFQATVSVACVSRPRYGGCARSSFKAARSRIQSPGCSGGNMSCRRRRSIKMHSIVWPCSRSEISATTTPARSLRPNVFYAALILCFVHSQQPWHILGIKSQFRSTSSRKVSSWRLL